MGFFSNLFKRSQQVEQRSVWDDMAVSLQYGNGSTYKTSYSMSLSAVYRCVDVISNAVASLPCRVYAVDTNGYKKELQNELSRILSKTPSDKMSAYSFYKLLVASALLNGNGYAMIVRENGSVKELRFIQAGYVSPLDCGDHIEYIINGVKNRVHQRDMIHIMNYTDNGVFGISTLTHARKTLGIAYASESSAEGFFKSGGCVNGYLKFDGPSTGAQKQEALTSWRNAFGAGEGQPGGIAVLPQNVSFQQLSVNPADAQLLESRKFNVEDICRFFGVSPIKCFDYTKSSYSTVEATELAFLNDTLRPLLVKIEQELERKLFNGDVKFDVKFDVTELLRADKAAQAAYYKELFNIGAITSNEVRKQLDLQPVEGGDEALVQVNLTKLKNIGEINNVDMDNRLKGKEENND